MVTAQQMQQLGRLSGILLPLFSLRSDTDFGIGDFGCAPGWFRWMEAARQRLWMVLPLLPTAPNDSSPYATRSAFGLNPLFIDISALPEFVEAGGLGALTPAEREQLEQARAAKRIRYDQVLPLKRAVLRRAFERFHEQQWLSNSARAGQLRGYLSQQAGWLDSFALFTAISDARDHQGWWEWPEPLRDRHPEALVAERERLAHEVLFQGWQQWIAEEQWSQLRAAAKARGILLCGDEPFIIGQDSSDTWANPKILRRDARLGVPPDDFSATGQDWGLPYFDFAAMEADDYAWLKYRAHRSAAYYDVRRIDHAVGYFRQWIRDGQTPDGRFIPNDQPTQQTYGERHLRILSESAGIVAEDLGVIPEFVLNSLLKLGLPGYRVMRWERRDGVYRNPRQYPEHSLATTGTHDTETLKEWWEAAPHWEREAVGRVFPELQPLQPVPSSFTSAVHEALLAAAESSSSDLCIVPWQDVLGTADRINLPGSVADANWSYRIEGTSDSLLSREDGRQGAERLARLTGLGAR